MKKIFLLVLTLFIAVTGCVHPPRHEKRTANLLDDKVISDRVQLQLRDKGAGQFSNVNASTLAGVVTLRGTVRDEEAKSRAVQIASQVDDVKGVDATQVQVHSAAQSGGNRAK